MGGFVFCFYFDVTFLWFCSLLVVRGCFFVWVVCVLVCASVLLFFCFPGGGVLIVLCEYGWCAYAE